MSTLKITNIQHASAASAAITLASDGSAAATLSSLNGGPLSGARNRIINGAMDIWQRGTSSSSTGYQTVDRFRYSDNGSGITITQSQQSFTAGQTDVPGEPTYFYRVAKTVAGTGGTFTAVEQGIEDVRSFAGQTATISFYAKCSSGTVSASVYLAQYFGSGGSANVNTSATTCTLTTTWQKFTATVSVPSISGKTIGSGSALFYTLSLPNNAIQTIDLSMVQVEPGSVATPFERRSYGQELALAMRYYYKLPPIYHQLTKNGMWESAAYYFPVKMRAAPTMSGDAWSLRGLNAGTDTGYSGFAYNVTTDSFHLTSSTTSNANFYTWVSGAVQASAEL